MALRVLGNHKQCCDGISRRAFLTATGYGALGLAGTMALPACGAPLRPRANAKAKSVIVLYLYGAPSQMDTFDPKPEAPVDVRGEFGTIATRVPGVRLCEHLPNLAGILDRVTLIRSMTHPYPTHAVAFALSGVPTSDPSIEANAREPRHWPYFGSVLDYLWSHSPQAERNPAVPNNVYLPWPLNSRTNNKMHGGLHAAWLGPRWDPVIPEFVGRATREQGAPSADGNTAVRSRFDPFDGITPESTFQFSSAHLEPEVTLERLHSRRMLLEQLDGQRRQLDGYAERFGENQRGAFDMLMSPQVACALDVTREPQAVREEYGYTLFGQGALAARRLVEAGVRVATVFWDEFGPVNTAWDTHANNFPRLKEGLCPTFDQVFPALLSDLERRGMMDETLVLVLTEHGRTPTLSRVPGGGREHWGYAYSVMMAGAGIRRGLVLGATDRQGGFPASRPVGPKDILATMYHLLGFDVHRTTTLDRQGQPRHLLPFGEVIPEVLV